MSVKTYELYKDSGIAWLGEVPSAWKVTAIKYGFDIKLGKMLQPEQKEDEEEQGPYVRAANIQWQGVDTSDIKLMWFSPGERRELNLQAEDLLVSEGGDVGRACLWRNELVNCHFQNSVIRVRSKPGNSTRFARYWLSALKGKGFIDVLCNKSTIAHYTAEKLAATPVLLPSHSEQLAIASFLDCETSKIDSLIAEQQRLIELLQEKRQAVISYAVTKGLNPNVPMKDSGVEWLGEVPEHWEVKPLKHLCEIYSGFPFKSDLFQPDGIPVVRMSNIADGSIDLQDAACVPEHEVPSEAWIRSGDLLLGLSGSVGNFGIARDCDLPAAVNQRVALIRTNNPILKHFLGSTLFSDQVTCGLPSTTIANVSSSQLGNCLLAVPPVNEQAQIEDFLYDFAGSSVDLRDSVESSISLLQERRSALISAAVTGQIDVRGLVPEEEAA